MRSPFPSELTTAHLYRRHLTDAQEIVRRAERQMGATLGAMEKKKNQHTARDTVSLVPQIAIEGTPRGRFA